MEIDIAACTSPDRNLLIPHVIVLEPGLVIFKIYTGYWCFGRRTIEEPRQDLRAVLKKCRPDWDITTPELKAAWRQGRKELFYPYIHTAKRTPKLSVNRIRKDLVIGCLTASAKGAATSNGWKAISKTDSC